MRGSVNHLLKIHPRYFDAVKSGRKTFEIRSTADRNFQVGDTLTLQEWDPAKYEKYRKLADNHNHATADAYTGRELAVRVTYVLAQDVQWQGKPAAVLGIQHDLFAEGL